MKDGEILVVHKCLGRQSSNTLSDYVRSSSDQDFWCLIGEHQFPSEHFLLGWVNTRHLNPIATDQGAGIIGPYASIFASPSFDCSKSSTPTERMLCNDARLLDLDGIMGEKYASLMEKLPDEGDSKIREAQRSWLRLRDETCGSSVANAETDRTYEDQARNCLMLSTLNQIVFLNDFTVN